MSDQVTLPPGVKPWEQFLDEESRYVCEDHYLKIQREAVMAERRHVASEEAHRRQVQPRFTFSERLTSLLFEFSGGVASNTPDSVLAGYLQRCLENWNATNRARSKHFETTRVEVIGLAGHCASNRGEILPLEPHSKRHLTSREMRAWLDSMVITSNNIGEIRLALFMPWDSPWNSLVREETGIREVSP